MFDVDELPSDLDAFSTNGPLFLETYISTVTNELLTETEAINPFFTGPYV
jgi:hypothetical protein